MTLKERYNKADTKELVVILENKKCYTTDCVNVVVNEFETRNINDGSAGLFAEEILRLKFKESLEKFDPYSSKIKLFESSFLSPEKVLEIQKQEFDKWLDKREVFGFDVWKYAIGAVG